MLLERTIPGISWVTKRIKDPSKSLVKEIKIFYYVLKSLNCTFWGTTGCWKVKDQFGNFSQNKSELLPSLFMMAVRDMGKNFWSTIKGLQQNFIVKHCKQSTISMVSWNATWNALRYSIVLFFSYFHSS